MRAFDIDFEDEEEQPNNNSALNPSLSSSNKFQASTYTRGFFNQEEEEHEIHVPEHSPSREEATGKKKRRQKKEPIKLEPLKQAQKVPVFQNYNREEDIEEISYQQLKTKKEQPPPSKTVETKPQPKHQEPREVSQERENPAPVINMPRTALVFEDDEEEVPEDPQTGANFMEEREEVVINRPNREHENVPGYFDNNSSDGQVVEVNNQENVQQIVGPEYFSYDSIDSLRRQLHTGIRGGNKLRMELIREKGGFISFWPQFLLHFSQNSHFLMCAKKTSSKPTSTFIISSRNNDFQESSPYYLGKMKSNVIGDELNIFGPGLNPSNARQQNQAPRELLATITYSSTIFQTGRPREFFVYVKKPEYKYYQHFPQVRMYQNEVPLHTLYQSSQNRDKIVLYNNKKPQWVDSIKGYMLNFRGRVEKASIKNFILQGDAHNSETVLFGKVNENKFNLDMGAPLSPFLAFAIALSSFDSRIMCE